MNLTYEEVEVVEEKEEADAEGAEQDVPPSSIPVDGSGFPSELLPVKPGLDSKGFSCLDDIERDIENRKAMNLSVASLNFYGECDLEVLNLLFLCPS